jgi:O-antigen ligase
MAGQQAINLPPIEPVATAAAAWRERRILQLALGAAFCAVPLSIALSDTFLAVAVFLWLVRLARRQDRLTMPRVFWFWLGWAGLEVAVWLASPDPGAGRGEIRHLILIGALFVTIPCLYRLAERIVVWRVVFLTATLGSAALIVGFFSRLIQYRRELAMGGDAAFYLRSGGLLHHWMVYATVEILVFAMLLEFKEEGRPRRWRAVVLAINCIAIVLSLTRALWIACLIVFGLHLVWRRSKWIWALPLLPAVVFLLVPGPIHQRMTESMLPDYYSNAERVQMWRVGWRMIRQHPLLGVGPGRVEQLYAQYLLPGELLPRYHGHLHNNAIHLAAQFGIVILGAAILFLAALVRDLMRTCRRARSPEEGQLARGGLLALTGFLTIGLMDYTYGHSLGLVLLAFAAISPLCAARFVARPQG